MTYILIKILIVRSEVLWVALSILFLSYPLFVLAVSPFPSRIHDRRTFSSGSIVGHSDPRLSSTSLYSLLFAIPTYLCRIIRFFRVKSPEEVVNITSLDHQCANVAECKRFVLSCGDTIVGEQQIYRWYSLLRDKHRMRIVSAYKLIDRQIWNAVLSAKHLCKLLRQLPSSFIAVLFLARNRFTRIALATNCPSRMTILYTQRLIRLLRMTLFHFHRVRTHIQMKIDYHWQLLYTIVSTRIYWSIMQKL